MLYRNFGALPTLTRPPDNISDTATNMLTFGQLNSIPFIFTKLLSRPITEVKQRRARLVFGWEHRVL